MLILDYPKCGCNAGAMKISNANLTGMSINGILVSDLLAAYEKLQDSV